MKCTLRPWRQTDADDLALVLNDKEILDNLRDGLPYPYTPADAAAFIAAMQSADPDSIYAFAITVEDRAIGCLSLSRQSNIFWRTAELGYYLARSWWGHGLATRAVRQACDLAFQSTDLLRVFALTISSNPASCRVVEKAGFHLEGTLRQSAVKNGQVQDIKLYAKLRQP